MACKVEIIADSVNPCGNRITTVSLRYWRAIHGELMTHRVFSRNASSSRAIPVAKMIEQVRKDPAGPIHWGANQPGMQARQELEGDALEAAQARWRRAAEDAANHAQALCDLGLHKQVANRVLEPWQWMHTVVTSTEWDNFFALRCHPDAQPEFQELARAIARQMGAGNPVRREWGSHKAPHTAWHLPYVTELERERYTVGILCKLSTARCARVSYLTHEGQVPNVDNDLLLHERLVGSDPIHASPTEHQACVLGNTFTEKTKNFCGWAQYRWYVETKTQVV